MRRYLYTLKGFIADGAFHTSIFFIQGVYNGGTAILMTAVLFGLEPTSARRSYLADIFQGLPKDIDAFKWKSTVVESGVLAGKLKASLHGKEGEFKSSRKTFENNMNLNSFNVSAHPSRIRVLEGLYSETLPPMKGMDIKLSFLRLDGEIYISTIQAVENAYRLVQTEVYIYVDDYGSFEGCRKAVAFFKQSVDDNSPLIPIYEDDSITFEAVWWWKPIMLNEYQTEFLPQADFHNLREGTVDYINILLIFTTINTTLSWVFLCRRRNLRN